MQNCRYELERNTFNIGICSHSYRVLLASWQLRLTKQQATTQFEDDLTRQYRDILRNIPIKALLGEKLDDKTYHETLDAFYRYIDLSNEQIFLRQNGRVSAATGKNWCDGIKSHLRRVTFSTAWQEIKASATDNFEELQRLEKSQFQDDPFDWK